jgi:hypothetical protein
LVLLLPQLLNFPWHHDCILHEAGIPPIHTPIKTLAALPDDVKERLHVVHVSASSIPEGSNLKVAQTGVENTIVLDVDVPEFSEAISVLNLIGGWPWGGPTEGCSRGGD